MRRLLRRVGALLVVALMALLVVNTVLAAARDQPVDGERLAPADLALVAEVERLRAEYGDEIWPGFATADIGLVVYNDRFEFLVADRVPSGFESIDDSDRPYVRRPADDPQAFAVDLGGLWAGSLPLYERMRRDYLRGMRNELPPVLAQLFPVWLADISPDLWTVGLLHEQMHAFQATAAPGRWDRALSAYEHEDRYPYDDATFASGWAAEGGALRSALEASTSDEACAAASTFLETRDERRRAIGLSPELVAFEQDLEWLEGLAKHAEIRSYELAAGEPGAAAHGYRPGLPHWTGEFDRLRNGLASADGDLRFYLSGMAQARLLDRLDPAGAWRTLLEDLVPEDALAEACGVIRS